MRPIFATIVLVALPALAVAQSTSPAPGGVPPLAPIGLPLPSITVPLPSIALPLPPLGLPPLDPMPPRIGDGRPSNGFPNARPPQGGRRNIRSAPTAIFVVPAYEWGYYPRSAQPSPPAPPPPSAPEPPPLPRETVSREPVSPTGRLRLEVQPADALQLFADGYYVGTAGDVNGELELEVGPHSIEIRAAGYETLAFDVKIAAGRSITYRAALKRSDAADAPPVPATRATTFYYIPGCYMGNVPPEAVALPATCDLSRLVTRKP